MVRRLEAVPVLKDKAELGECPVWDEGENLLWWIDWSRDIVYRSDLTSGASRPYQAGPSLAAVALTDSRRIALALDHGFAELDPGSGRVRELARAEPAGTASRMCDGKCDALGRFWAGTMALDEQSPLGALFVMENDGGVRRVLDDVVISNGLCWSLDDRRFYYVDSATGRIDEFKFELAGGTIAHRAPFVQIPAEAGTPDGLTIDGDGYLWVALWDGWQVRRYDPRGKLDSIVEVPVARPTCCTLGGAGLQDLIITTAMPDGADERRAQPLAGSVFRVRVDCPGRPAHRCRYEPRS